MEPHLPFLLVRATPKDHARDAFFRWFRDVHLRDAARIPGFSTIEWGNAGESTVIGIYTFAAVDAVQQTLASPEAAHARGTWEQWADKLHELQIEMFAPLGSMPMFRLPN